LETGKWDGDGGNPFLFAVRSSVQGITVKYKMNCAICATGMPVPEYDHTKLGGNEGECVRLPCHHAFHSYCIVESLRQAGSGCPICRDGAPQTNRLAEIFEALGFEEEDDTTELTIDDDLMHDIRSRHPEVKRKRTAFHKLIKQYNVHKDALRHRRHVHLSIAIEQFRKKEQPRIKAFQHQVRACIRDLVHIETGEYARRSSQETLEAAPWYESYLKAMEGEYLREAASERRHDPINPAFWRP